MAWRSYAKKVGTGNVSVANEVAEVQKLLKASGLKYTMHSAGTTVGESFPSSALPSVSHQRCSIGLTTVGGLHDVQRATGMKS